MYTAVMILFLSGCNKNNKSEVINEEKIKVGVTTVVSVKDDNTLTYSGTIEASRTIPLTFKTPGTVENVYVEEGDAVKKGQLLATLDNSDMQNIYNSAEIKYEQAKDAYDRLKSVYEKGSLPEIKWVEMKSGYAEAASALEIAKNNLEKCRMSAPEDGIIGRRNIEPGQSSVVLSSAPFELVKTEVVLVKISVPENEIVKIKKGQQCSFSVPALDDKGFQGTVTHLSPVADAISRTYAVKISVNNKGYELKPGMICDISMHTEGEVSSLVIPYNAVSVDNEGKQYVYVVSENKDRVKKQYVRTGKYKGSGIRITEGLTEGQVVVCSGNDKLSDNTLISL